MSLQQIMDATPIVSWTAKESGDGVGSSHKYAYFLANERGLFMVWWIRKNGEDHRTKKSENLQQIIDKINELEGIK